MFQSAQGGVATGGSGRFFSSITIYVPGPGLRTAALLQAVHFVDLRPQETGCQSLHPA